MRSLLASVFAVVALFMASSAMCGDYVINAGDELNVNVWGEKELNAIVTVRPDGKISLPGIGDVEVAKLSPLQAQEKLTKKLGEIVKNPVVTVSVKSSQNNTVVVHGPGIKPGVVPLEGRTTLLQLLTRIAPESFADLDATTVTRNGQLILTGVRELYERGKIEGDVELLPGDRIFIPFREKWSVYVIGAVEKPQAIPHHEGMTVLEAVLAAGGFTKFADRNDTEIVRHSADAKEVIRIRAGDLIDKGDLKENRAVEPGDYIIAKKGFF